MLSNPTNLQQRQRQHRRQQSTPTAFEAPKVPSLPTLQRNGSHRRGISLDQRRRQSPSQDNVSITNHGLQQIQQHHIQETQQHRLSSQGPRQASYLNSTNDDSYITSPFVSPQRQYFDTGNLNSYGGPSGSPQVYSPYSGHINSTFKVSPNDSLTSDNFGVNDSMLYSDPGSLTPSTFGDFSMNYGDSSGQQDWGATIKPSTRVGPARRISGGIADRVARFEGIPSNQSRSRPITPPNQNVSNYFPPTPDHTPFTCAPKIEPVPQRFLDDYDSSMEATIKPIRRDGNQRAKTIFQEMREHTEMNRPLSPPHTAPIPSSSMFDSARMPPSKVTSMAALNEYMRVEKGYVSSDYSPKATHIPNSQFSSPEMSQASLSLENFPQSQATDTSFLNEISHDTSSIYSSPMQRSASVESMGLEEVMTDTGVTIDDIACYIDGPDPLDQKWSCLFPECNKRFGRKENIKSHVQTHLGDRQFQCPHCKKCFVRQHDLKRHAKIHSGVKPYPCACGNSFARHDALTRHRQRGMCIGAFEGVVKKVVKRGRPRKERPDTDTRLEKSSRTRSKNKSISSSSSASVYSESSYSHSPRADLDILDDKPFGDFGQGFSQLSSTISQRNVGFSPSQSNHADYISPHAIQNAPSPSYSNHSSSRSYYSNHRGSVSSISEHQLPSHPSSPAKSYTTSMHQIQSQYNTPPELCLSSSSPTASAKFYDIPENEQLDLSKLAPFETAQQDDLFLDAFGDSDAMGMGMSRLEQDPDLLLMGGKFDDSFAVVDNDMYGDNLDDVFFGSP